MFFEGFPAGKMRLTSLPDPFFTDLLPKMENLDELKVFLFAFYLLGRREGTFRYLERDDFAQNTTFMDGLEQDSRKAAQALDAALSLCVAHGVFLDVQLEIDDCAHTYYFMNTAKGRAAVNAIRSGKWRPSAVPHTAPLTIEKANIFRLYEENIAPLTPMIADLLRDAEKVYPAAWIEQAMQIAVARNARNWRYIEAILRGWKERGRDDSQNRGDTEADRRKYVEGKYAEYINR